MNKFSKNLYKSIIDRFPPFQQKNQNLNNLELDIEALGNKDIGGLVIQTTDDNNIWIRNYHPYSGYSVESAEELLTIMEGIFNDEILWVIGYKNEEWVETTLCRIADNLEAEKGITYKIFSWSGALDRNFTAD